MNIAPTEHEDFIPGEATLEVLLFGALKDAARTDLLRVRIPQTLSVALLLERIAQECPALEKYLPHVRVAVNCEYSATHAPINAGDEVALIPPVAGG